MCAKILPGSLLFKSALLLAVVVTVLVIGWWYAGSLGVASANKDGFEYELLSTVPYLKPSP